MPVSKATARVDVDDVIAAVHPNTCLISVMLANNETGVIMVRRERGGKLGNRAFVHQHNLFFILGMMDSIVI